MILKNLLTIWSSDDKICILHSDTAKCIFEGTVQEAREAESELNQYSDCMIEYAAIQDGEIVIMAINPQRLKQEGDCFE